jgi:tetratricopeptide (TPR) repeat protein
LDKALEIKRRAQRSIQNGDLDGALTEYEKLVALPDCDPYNFVLLADLLFKRGDQNGAVERYLAASSSYETSGLYKNAIAVCKKMMRLGLSPAQVLGRLAHLHQLDGLETEAALYFQQYAEHLVRERRPTEVAAALRKAFEVTPDDLRLLERTAEVYVLAEDKESAALALAEAAFAYHKRGAGDVAVALKARAEELKPGSVRNYEVQSLLRSGQQPPPPVEEPEAAGDDDDVPANPGPPLLPSLRGEVGEESDFERFPGRAVERTVSVNGANPGGETGPSRLLSAAEIEGLLQQAQEKVRTGDADGASKLLDEAALAYEAVGRHDNAATIYRSLGKSQSTTSEVLERWLANCERREDKREAAIVACELGDRAIARGEVDRAQDWFERARGFDENNPLALRRLQRLAEMKEGVGPPQLVGTETPTEQPTRAIRTPTPPGPPLRPPALQPEPVASAPPESVEPEAPLEAPMAAAFDLFAAPVPLDPALPSASSAPPSDRVELAVGRSEAVNFDLGALLSEFQRGIESQLSGDAQGHYDLAMAYREMGLLDHAIESFRMAVGHPALSHRAAEMLGRCLLDQGRFDEAVAELSAALEHPGLDAEGALGLQYLLGLALEAAGRTQDAVAVFEQVFAVQPNYHDVAQKLRNLGKGREAA